MSTRILTLLNVRPGEERNVFLMLAHYFFMGGAMLFVQSASYALFFEKWDATAMPYIYLGIAVIVTSITALFLKISERSSLARFLILCLVFILAGTIALRIGLAFTSSKWLMLALPIWSQSLVNISVMAFWTLAGNLFDVRQGKRIFGLMNAGSWLAYVVMGPLTTPLVKSFGTENLYTAVAVFVFIAIIFQLMILRANPKTSVVPQSVENQKQKKSIFSLLQNRYIALIFSMIALWRIAYFFLDNIFYDRTALQFTDAAAMAGFIGGFFSAVGLLGFITDTFLTGRIISRFGLRAGLLVTPTLILFFMGIFVFTGMVDSGQILLLFWVAVASKSVNEGFGFSLDQSAFAILSQPIAEKDRARAQTVTEGIIQPLAIGLAGGLLLLFNTLLKFNAIQLSYLYLAIGAAWVIVGVTLVRAYPAALTEALHKRRFGDDGITLTNTSKYLIRKALASPHPSEVLYALDLLEISEDPFYRQSLVILIDSSRPEIRENAIQRIERLHLGSALPHLFKRLRNEPEARLRELTARAISAISKDTDSSLALLDDSDEHIRRGALVGLLRSNDSNNVPSAQQRLIELSISKSHEDRSEAAKLMAEIGKKDHVEILLNLLGDNELAVRKEALRTAIRIKHPSIYPAVIAALKSPHTRSLAFNALVSGSDMALPEIVNGLKDETLHRRIHLRLIRVYSHIKSEAAVNALEGWIQHPNANLRSRVLIALDDCKYKPKGDSVRRINDQIQAEMRRAAWVLASIGDLGTSDKTETVIRALDYDLGETRNRLFHLLSFVYDPRPVQRARKSFARKDSSRRAYAIEIMDSTLARNHKNGFIPLLEDYSAKERLQKMGAAYKQDELSPAARVLDILSNQLALENPWLVATAIEIANHYGVKASGGLSQSLMNSNETLIVRAAGQMETENKMLSTVERVIILKSLSMFADTPDEALAELAELLHEEDVNKGEVIVKEGDPGESLYVIIRGKVDVLGKNQLITQLGERSVFGELSLLDSSPRTATIRAAEDTTLLRLDQTPFYEIMSDYVEVAMGTIHMLTRSLRERTNEVIEINKGSRQ